MSNRYYLGPRSDHFDGTRFFNPGVPPSDKSLLDVLRWRLGGHRARWPKTVPARFGLKPEKAVSGLQVTCIGHASLLLQVAGVNLLIDPVWSERASPFPGLGPRRRNAPAVAMSDLPPIHAILVSHNHYDHMDLATLKALWERDHPCMLAPLGNYTIIRTAGQEIDVKAGDWWESFTLSGEISATIVPSYHWSSRGLRDRRMALWGGFYLDTPRGSIYLAGDTACREAAIFREIKARCGSPLLAALPIGAYAPRWFMNTQHADPGEAIRIAQDCGAQYVLGIHSNTFPLTDEPHDDPAKRFHAAAAEVRSTGMRAQAFTAGDTWTLPGSEDSLIVAGGTRRACTSPLS